MVPTPIDFMEISASAYMVNPLNMHPRPSRTNISAFRDAIIPNRCMLRRLVLGEGDAVDDAWLFSFHMHRLVAAESEHLGGTA